MAEAALQAGKALSAQVVLSAAGGGTISLNLATDNVEVVGKLTTAAVTLGAIYAGYKIFQPAIQAAVYRALGGDHPDQKIRDIGEGSLHVVLHCFTDKRFQEVLGDYESGNMKKRFEQEFEAIGLKVKGLKVKIENMLEVNEINEAIKKRYKSHDLIMSNGPSST